MKLLQDLLESIEEDESNGESEASKKAKEMGLDYMRFGRYGKDGKVTHISQGGQLVPVQKSKPGTPHYQKPTKAVATPPADDPYGAPVAPRKAGEPVPTTVIRKPSAQGKSTAPAEKPSTSPKVGDVVSYKTKSPSGQPIVGKGKVSFVHPDGRVNVERGTRQKPAYPITIKPGEIEQEPTGAAPAQPTGQKGEFDTWRNIEVTPADQQMGQRVLKRLGNVGTDAELKKMLASKDIDGSVARLAGFLKTKADRAKPNTFWAHAPGRLAHVLKQMQDNPSLSDMIPDREPEREPDEGDYKHFAPDQ